jgi:outer membrane protein assembly factor BamB
MAERVSWSREICCCLAAIVGFCIVAMADAPAIGQIERTDAEHIGRAPSLEITDTSRVLWRFDAGDRSIGSAIMHGETLFVTVEGGEVNALDANTGKLLWSHDLDARYFTGITTAGAEKSAIVVTSDTCAAALDAITGEKLWQADIGGGLAGPVAWENRVYAAGNDGLARAFDVATGEVLWTSDFLKDAPPDPEGFEGKRARAGAQLARPRSASCDGETVFFSVFDQCRTIALRCSTGERRWAFRTQGWMFGRPTVTRQSVLVGSQDDWLYCIDKDMGSEAWRFQTEGRIEAACAVHDGKVYAGSCDGHLYCLEEDTGKLVWKTSIEKGGRFHGAIYEQPLIGSETIYLPALDGLLYAFDPATGAIKWSLTPSPDSEIDISFTDGRRIYVGMRKSSKEKGENAILAIGE